MTKCSGALVCATIHSFPSFRKSVLCFCISFICRLCLQYTIHFHLRGWTTIRNEGTHSANCILASHTYVRAKTNKNTNKLHS
jgi:hypothetical protein